MIETRKLHPDDVAHYVAFRQTMLRETPWAFAANPDDDRGSNEAHLRDALMQDYYDIVAVIGAGGQLLAAAGVHRPTNPKFSHRAKVWGVYTDALFRRRGYGRGVVSSAVDIARGWGVSYVDLGVSASADAAIGLYESLGFVAWGREPESTFVDGTYHDEIFMSLKLKE